jgi:LPPG:FO 2-phospho-L-lactate transferase
MSAKKVLALTGGVGGAKLGLGLTHCLAPEALTFVVNTGDDFEHLGLPISPDLDTLLYTLAAEANATLETLRALGGAAWFQLGDRDLALHLRRRELLDQGARLTEATAALAQAFKVPQRLLPMSDNPVRTQVTTDQGVLPFQEYFVRERCAPAVSAITYAGAEAASLSPELTSAFADPALSLIVLCPSNPFLSVAPLLAIPGLRRALAARRVPAVAICPLVGGAAVKGPTAKLMDELAMAKTPAAIARYYEGIIDGLILDQQDAAHAEAVRKTGVTPDVAPTLMLTLADKVALAEHTLRFGEALST